MSFDRSLRRTNGSSEDSSSIRRKDAEPVVLDGRDEIFSVGFLADGKHVVGGGQEGKIRRWRIEDGGEVGAAMEAGSGVLGIAVSRDGKLIVGGTIGGRVTVWDAESHSKVGEVHAHRRPVNAVDVSPDATKIATGSNDHTACVWSLSTGERLLPPLKHDHWVVAAKFSPDGRLIATATWEPDFVRVYDSQNGGLLVDFPFKVNSPYNQSLAWASDSKTLFALSKDGCINHVDVFAKTTLFQWHIHSRNDVRCVALAGNSTFIAASAGSSVSFWDTTTRKQIGSVIKYTHTIWSMAISSHYDLVTSGETKITLPALCDILPSEYIDNTRTRGAIGKLRHQLADPRDNLIKSLRAQEESSNSKIALLEKTVQELRNELAKSQRAANEQKGSLNEIIRSLRADLHTQETSSTTLNKVVHDLRNEKDSLNETINSLRADLRTRDESSSALLVQLADAQRKIVRINRAHEQKHQCESLYAQGQIRVAAECLLEIADTVDDDVRANKFIMDWLSEFAHRCVTTLERAGDEALNAGKRDEAVAAYTAALSLGPSPNTVLMKCAGVMLVRDSADEVLKAAVKFKVPRFVVYRVICDILEGDGRLTEAVECFRQLQHALPEDPGMHDERVRWEHDFRGRCLEKLEKLGDTARDSRKHDEAIGYYSTALLLDPMNVHDILLKRSNEVIELDPSSHRGYEGKHAALHGMERYGEAFEEFRIMLSKLAESPDPQIRQLGNQYVDATATIQQMVQETIRRMPRVLIDITTGHLYDKTQQAAAFEGLPIYDELRSSMTTRLDRARIRKEVKKFYRYVMFSHKWQPNEPTFQQVEKMSVYKLPASPAFGKLQNFCKLVRTLRFEWAWSDTCCVNQLDRGVQQESLVAMFRWYRGSSLTIVHLLGVFSQSQKKGCLWRSIWNTRGWTYQEYVASEVVQFYTEDWKPYLGLDIFNHKESPIIFSEMEQAMNFATRELATLQPGLERAREKLYLASRRETTREEDIAYSLFGIFNVAIPVIYGEGNQAVGRLLEHILSRSVDVTLLAWTGRSSSSEHSYLPADLTVYNEIVPLHVPRPIERAEMEDMVTALRLSLADASMTAALYERLYHLPRLSLSAGRLRLPGIVFPLADLVPVSESDPDSDLPVYRATSPMLGDVEIKTSDDLSDAENLLLIHPWISTLLDQDFSRGVAQCDLAMRALRLVARLRQPFGPLLLATLAREQYRRVATDSLIMVRVREETSLTELMDGIRTVDVQ